MDATAWVALAGIAGTLLGTLSSPLLAERMRRESVRREALLNRRLSMYADLLRATARVADNAMAWSSIPLADLKETDDEDLNRIVSLARVVASDQVYAHLTELSDAAQEFNRLLFSARVYHARLQDEGHVDDSRSIEQRMALGSVADKLQASYKEMERSIRSEVKP
jgi:hypothetical protein